MSNAINVIKPYKWNGMWVFDDERVDLDKEPFVAGADTMIDTAIEMKGIQNADEGFLLVFSEFSFPNADFEITWNREESAGNVYKWRLDDDGEEMEGWLCPALNLYLPGSAEEAVLAVAGSGVAVVRRAGHSFL